MDIGILIDGDFEAELIRKALSRYEGLKGYFYPAELHLDKVLQVPVSQLHPMHKNAGFGADAAGDLVFRLVNKVDALLVFTDEVNQGVVYAALRKAMNYSMPVEIVDGQGNSYQPRYKQEARAVAGEEGGGTSQSTLAPSAKLEKVRATEGTAA